ncbi:hypothetical protein [Mucisphaera sp.]|uniref:hypothetical protein n=1 Tax=Mucisphaera sp. TaxID=2913024 RepID=UPI003D0CA1A8
MLSATTRITLTPSTGRAVTVRRGLTGAETLLSLAVGVLLMAGGLWLTAGYAESLRKQANEDILTAYGSALQRYETISGTLPSGSAATALETLAGLESTRATLVGLPIAMRPDGVAVPLDAYGTPLAYSETSRGALPVGEFVSAGADLTFGDAMADDPALIEALIDDSYSSDFEQLF